MPTCLSHSRGMPVRSGSRLLGAMICAVLAFGLSACSSSSTGLTTASLLPASKPKEADTATERALQVAATSARATRCGYNFDAGRLRTAYLAYESTQEGAADKLGRLEKTYDFTQAEVAKKIGPPDEYCTDDQTAKIKADLTRHLAGDYTPVVKKPEPGLLDGFGSSSSQEWDKKKTLCPKQNCV